MPKSAFLGEWEQLVLLGLLRLGEDAHVLDLRNHLSDVIGRRVARGALYRTLERLEEKRYIRWVLEAPGPGRGGHPRRRFLITKPGIAALSASRHALLHLWKGFEGVLE
jgi:PadR family transcriptional regulator PadR